LVTWAQIKHARTKGKDAEGGIVGAILKRYPDFDKNKLGRVAGLFARFYTEMKPGDVVVMPSAGSDEYAFGIVTDGEPFEVVGWSSKNGQ
jgi:predicted Mrr-cat superfamily restriction endonuclease